MSFNLYLLFCFSLKTVGPFHSVWRPSLPQATFNSSEFTFRAWNCVIIEYWGFARPDPSCILSFFFKCNFYYWCAALINQLIVIIWKVSKWPEKIRKPPHYYNNCNIAQRRPTAPTFTTTWLHAYVPSYQTNQRLFRCRLHNARFFLATVF